MECSVKNIFGALLFVLFVSSVGCEDHQFKPSHYKLEIFTKQEHYEPPRSKADKELRFDGKVTIKFTSKQITAQEFKIVLDADSKTQISAKDGKQILELKGGQGTASEILSASGVIQNNKLVVTCNNQDRKPMDTFELVVGFSNPFGNDMTGFYRSFYKDIEKPKDGSNTNEEKERVLLTTHFEPIFARKAFPCFDRPDLKAVFEIHITTPGTITTVLSNTKKADAAPSGEYKIHKFKETDIPMSTYLVAFTASNLGQTTESKFRSLIYTPKRQTIESGDTSVEKTLITYGRHSIITKKKEAELAQKIGKAAMEELSNYLGVGYALEKIDQVGIPDFSAGAMENFGHVSYREKALFNDETKGTAAAKQAIVLTVTHELVHQWFGNLVTLKSWNYIWLNEAFATYIEYIIASKFTETKDWNLLNQMVVNEIHSRAFETDGLESSKPLDNKIEDDNMIFASFNDIPYSKGAAVLRMWNLQLAKDQFQKALKEYLMTNREGAVESKQLKESFKKVGVKENNFDSWTTKPGYPVVEVKKINGTYTLSQTRFYWDEKTDNEARWVIPITFSSDKSPNFDTVPKVWLTSDSQTLNHTCKWIIVNNEQAGYYRVNYDKENWNALAKALTAANHSGIPEVSRAQIVNDVFSLARSLQKDYVGYSTALSLATYLKEEKSFIPWKTALHALEFLRTKIDKSDMEKFKKYVIPLISPHFKNLNSTGMSHVDKLKNVEMARMACSLDYELCVKQAKEIFNKTTYGQLPDTQEIILCTVVRKETKAWDVVSEKYKTEDDSALKVMYISALGCTGNQEQVEKFLNGTLSDNCFIRNQDLSFALSSMYNGNLNNVETAFKFIEKNYRAIAKKYGGINPLGRALVGIARKLKTADQYKRLVALTRSITEAGLSGTKESIDNALNIANSNVKWVEKKMKQVKDYINSGSFLSYSIALLSLSLLTVFQF